MGGFSIVFCVSLPGRVSDQGSEMHLVVQVRKCESLAIADEEKGVSSPFLRVSRSAFFRQNGYVWKCWVNIPNEIAI